MAAPKLTPDERLERRRAANRASERKRRENAETRERMNAAKRDARKRPEVREARKAESRKYRDANREAIQARRLVKKLSAEAVERKRAQNRLTMKRWREADPERNRAHVREWREKPENRERDNAASRKWSRENPDKRLAHHHNRRALLRNAPGRHTAADVAALFERQRAKCAACKAPVTKTGMAKYHVDHIQPLARGGSNDPANLQLLCKACNLSKHARDPHEWAREKGLLFL